MFFSDLKVFDIYLIVLFYFCVIKLVICFFSLFILFIVKLIKFLILFFILFSDILKLNSGLLSFNCEFFNVLFE